MRTRQPRRAARLLRGFGALIVLLAIVVGVPLFAVALQRSTGLTVIPHSVPSVHYVEHTLTQRDNGQLVAVVLAIGVWICWALFTASLVTEIVAAARNRPSRPVPGLTSFQRPAGALVAAIAVAFTVAPLITGVGAAAAQTAGPPPPLPTVVSASFAALPTFGGHTASSAQHGVADPAPSRGTTQSLPGAPHTDTRPSRTSSPANADDGSRSGSGSSMGTYTVQHRDTLWKIAEDHLGNPLRYEEIVKLNVGSIGPDNEISAGTVLAMPADATDVTHRPDTPPAHAHSDSNEVRVRPGDTLWSLEERASGSGANWKAGWDHNKGRAEPGGEHFTNPNEIRPGWTLSIPTSAAASTHPPAGHPPARTHQRTAPATPTPSRPAPPAPHQHPTPQAPSTPAPSTPSPATPPPAPHAADHRAPSTDASSRAQSSSRYEVLGVGGGMLAAVSAAALMVHRRRKFQRRRLGRAVASLPPELIPLEQALFTSGRTALPKMTFLDLALRHLATQIAADPAGALPDIIGAALNEDYLELYLAAEPAAPPDPWLATDPRRWTLSRSAQLSPASAGRLAPYPCLVSIGYTDDGTEYLLDLEHVGALQVTGENGRCLDLARYMVAELANNVWSDHLTVTAAGFGKELVDANPDRLAYTDNPAQASAALRRAATANSAAAAEAGVTVLEGRLRGIAGDVWMPQILLAAPGRPVPDSGLELELEETTRAATEGGRAAVAVVLAGHERTTQAHHLSISAGGILTTSLLGVGDMTAYGLPADLAEEMAQAIALDRGGDLDEAIPAAAGSRPWDSFTDAAGALLPEYTLPREPTGRADGVDPAGTSCVLPAPDEVYVSEAATTTEDLAALAPAVPPTTRAAVEEADPDLDSHVFEWFNPNSELAKLDVLSPAITLTAQGRRPGKKSLQDMCIEAVTYLWHHPAGVTTAQFANDLWPDHNYEGTDSRPKDVASMTRHWLGIDPRTGTEYLPRATRGGLYRVDGLLVSWDLFRRLRTRGVARGIDGRQDLMTALNLVDAGRSMTQLRDFGYRWMPAGEDLLYAGAIVEVAHTVASWSLKAEDFSQALHACEVALQLNPEDERALVCIAKAHDRAGRHAEKDATILRLKMLPEPTERTVEVMRRNGWLARGA